MHRATFANAVLVVRDKDGWILVVRSPSGELRLPAKPLDAWLTITTQVEDWLKEMFQQPPSPSLVAIDGTPSRRGVTFLYAAAHRAPVEEGDGLWLEPAAADLGSNDKRDSFAFSDHGCVALLGVENVVVVATEDAVLVASKEHSEQVKGIVEQMRANGGAHALYHNRVYRPWGWYQTINRGDRYQVKCIMVKPGAMLSLQSHFHRSEHWVVVKGTLEVTKGEEVELLSENQSTYIPIGKPHRLTNPGKIPAFLIEVQSGSYLEEDDIVRFEDIYGRSAAD